MGNQCKLTTFEEKEELNIIKKTSSPYHTFKQIDDLKKDVMELSLFERKSIATKKRQNGLFISFLTLKKNIYPF